MFSCVLSWCRKSDVSSCVLLAFSSGVGRVMFPHSFDHKVFDGQVFGGHVFGGQVFDGHVFGGQMFTSKCFIYFYVHLTLAISSIFIVSYSFLVSGTFAVSITFFSLCHASD